MTPHFLIIGAARSGTSALYEYLAEHPDLFLTRPKEPHYFALAGTKPTFTGPGDRQTINRLAVTDRNAYWDLYRKAEPGQVRGEASVSTLYYPNAIVRLRQEVPDARLIVLLRDPVDRAYSAYGFMRMRLREPCTTFERALTEEARRIASGWHHIWHYTAMGWYGEQMRHVLRLFPREQVLALQYEDLVAEPESVLRRVHHFLGVEAIPPTVKPYVHPSGEPRWRFVSRVITNPHLKKVALSFVPAHQRRPLLREMWRRNAVRSTCSDETRRMLVETFRSDVELLEQLIGLDLSAWRKPESTTRPWA